MKFNLAKKPNNIIPFALTTAVVSLFPISAKATIINGDFADSLNNWLTSGDVSDFNNQALLTTASSELPDDFPQDAGSFNFSNNKISNISELNDFLGLNSFNLGLTATEGSAIQQQFTAKKGNILSFDWKFLTNEDTPDELGFSNDAAFIVLKPISSSSVTITPTPLADTNSIFKTPNTNLGFESETEWTPFTSPTLEAGEYIFGLVIVDDGDINATSALLVDNIKIVPEPFTILGTAIALGFGTFFQKKLGKK